jgi:hypothetical protein
MDENEHLVVRVCGRAAGINSKETTNTFVSYE